MRHPVRQDTGSDLSLGRGKERRKGIGDFRWITSSEENIASAARVFVVRDPDESGLLRSTSSVEYVSFSAMGISCVSQAV